MGQMLSNFVIGICASLIAAAIIFLTATWRPKLVRRALTAVASTFLGIQVRYVFPNGKDAESTIIQELAESSRIRIFAGRGLQFQESLYAPLLHGGTASHRNVQILLPNPDQSRGAIDWITHREDELSRIDRSFGNEMLRKQIRTSIEFLLTHQHDKLFQLRLYDIPHIGRIIITDQSVFFTPYSAMKHGRDCRVFQYGTGDIYDNFARWFEMVWEDSVEAPSPGAEEQTVT